jgi:hypothetical protein
MSFEYDTMSTDKELGNIRENFDSIFTIYAVQSLR